MSCPRSSYYRTLNLTNVLSHRSSLILFYVKGHAVTLGEGLKSGRSDGRKVNEYIWAVFLFNKTISLFITKPFYDSFCQNPDLLLKMF